MPLTIPPESLTDVSEEIIAGGTFAKVYKATYKNQSVVIKKALSEYDSQSKKNLENEAEVLQKLDHPNIIKLQGITTFQKYMPSLVLDFMENGTLMEMIFNGVQVTESQRLKIELDIAYALDYVHGQNIVICNLNPANILLDKHLNIKLCGFGSAQTLQDGKYETEFDTLNMSTTLRWKAPETLSSIIFGTRTSVYTPQSDMYGYGLTIWSLEVRQYPFQRVEERYNKKMDDIAIRYERIRGYYKEDVSSVQNEIVQKMILKLWPETVKDRLTAKQAIEILEPELAIALKKK